MKFFFFMLPLLMMLCVSPHTRCDQDGDKDIRQEVLNAFMLKRLDKAAHLIEQLHKKGIFPKLCAKIPGNMCTIFDNETLFVYEDINHCKELIQIKKSLQPFLELWADIQEKKTQITLPYLKEVALLILKIYKAIYTACTPDVPVLTPTGTKNLAFQAIGALFGNIAGLQAFELLTIIEKLTVQIPKLLEKYEITTGNLTWKEWIIKYWWLPPMAVAAIVLECAFIYQVATGAKKLPALKTVVTQEDAFKRK